MREGVEYHVQACPVRPGGDSILVYKDGEKLEYVVNKHFEVTSDQIDILDSADESQLTLYTCTDLNYTKRLVVIALPLPATTTPDS